MAVNKVIYDGATLVDLTGDTVTADNLAAGVKATGADGKPITGLLPKVTIDAELSSTSTNPVQNKVIKAELDKKMAKTDKIYEANLEWGGRNIADDYSPIDAAMVPFLGANRFAFAHAGGITVEYSTDAGETWLDYGLSDAEKIGLLTIPNTKIYIGKAPDNPLTPASMLRVTINPQKIGLYTRLNKFIMQISTNGCRNCYCTIDASLKSTPETFKVFADKARLLGWSGWNVINTEDLTTYSNDVNLQYDIIRFTFGCTEVNTKYRGLGVYCIFGFGGVGWDTPSNMAQTGHLYNYDANQNAVFPGNVTAKQFNGVATKALQDGEGNTFADSYLKLNGGNMRGTIRTVQDTKPAINFRAANTNYGVTLNYDSSGNEALALNIKNSVTSFLVNTNVDGESWTSNGKWCSTTPALQIKNNCVYINELIPNNVKPSYKLNVNGETNIKGDCTITNTLTVSNVNSANVLKTVTIDGTTVTVTKGDGTTYTLSTQDTVYTHPATHPASMITGLASVATSGSYSDLSNKPTIPVVPTNVSAFINDAGYLTQHQSLDDYAKKTDVNTALANKLGINDTAAAAIKDDAGNTISTTYASKADVSALLSTKLGVTATAYAATRDGAGNNIVNTYAKKTDIPSAYTLPNATSSTLGGVKIGSNISVADGTISITKSNVTSALGYTPPASDTTYGDVTTTSSGLMSSTDKVKLNGIADNANYYIHPPTHPASMISGLATVATSGSYNDLTNKPGNATTSAAGLMSAADKATFVAIITDAAKAVWQF